METTLFEKTTLPGFDFPVNVIFYFEHPERLAMNRVVNRIIPSIEKYLHQHPKHIFDYKLVTVPYTPANTGTDPDNLLRGRIFAARAIPRPDDSPDNKEFFLWTDNGPMDADTFTSTLFRFLDVLMERNWEARREERKPNYVLPPGRMVLQMLTTDKPRVNDIISETSVRITENVLKGLNQLADLDDMEAIKKVLSRAQNIVAQDERNSKKDLEKLVVVMDEKERFRIYLGGRTGREVEMKAFDKAVYLLLLLYPAGLPFNEIPDHNEELDRIYVHTVERRTGRTAREGSISKLGDPYTPSLSEKLSHIRNVFRDTVGGTWFLYAPPEDKATKDNPRNIRIDLWDNEGMIELPQELWNMKNIYGG